MSSAYSYCVLRYVHDIASKEFVNVGIVMFAPSTRTLLSRCKTSGSRISKMFPGAETDWIKSFLRNLEANFSALGNDCHENGALGRFKSVMDAIRSIYPADESGFQWSEEMSGLAEDLPAKLDFLVRRYVELYEEEQQRTRRTDEAVWRTFKQSIDPTFLAKYFTSKKIEDDDLVVEFSHAAKNGIWHCVEPLSFDLATADGIAEKADRWLGKITKVKDSEESFRVYFVVGEPRAEQLRAPFERAIRGLEKSPVNTEVVRESEAASFAERLKVIVETHK